MKMFFAWISFLVFCASVGAAISGHFYAAIYLVLAALLLSYEESKA